MNLFRLSACIAAGAYPIVGADAHATNPSPHDAGSPCLTDHLGERLALPHARGSRRASIPRSLTVSAARFDQ